MRRKILFLILLFQVFFSLRNVPRMNLTCLIAIVLFVVLTADGADTIATLNGETANVNGCV